LFGFHCKIQYNSSGLNRLLIWGKVQKREKEDENEKSPSPFPADRIDDCLRHDTETIQIGDLIAT
jgi:hypothetical protein